MQLLPLLGSFQTISRQFVQTANTFKTLTNHRNVKQMTMKNQTIPLSVVLRSKLSSSASSYVLYILKPIANYLTDIGAHIYVYVCLCQFIDACVYGIVHNIN